MKTNSYLERLRIHYVDGVGHGSTQHVREWEQRTHRFTSPQPSYALTEMPFVVGRAREHDHSSISQANVYLE